MNNFKEWLNGNEMDMTEVVSWMKQISSQILNSIQQHPGYISVKISSKTPIFASPAPQVQNAPAEPTMSLAASTVNLGALVSEASREKGWKGDAAVNAVKNMGGNWSTKDQNTFRKAMGNGKQSLPMLVGREMGLLFEIEIFIFLVTTFKLKPIGQKDLAWSIAERSRLINLINSKVGPNLGRLVQDFIQQHAGGNGMGQLIHGKAMALVRECIVNSIEFTGGTDGTNARLREDTADLRIGCEQYLNDAMRTDVGFSLKAVTNTTIEVRTFSNTKALAILGSGRRAIKQAREMLTNPLYEPQERRNSLMTSLFDTAKANYENNPRKFASLLELLVTGGADTIPAYRNLINPDSSPGWSGAIAKDFNTKESPGKKLGARNSAEIKVIKTNSYVKLTYISPTGNHAGTSVIIEPDGNGASVKVKVSNLLSKGH